MILRSQRREYCRKIRKRMICRFKRKFLYNDAVFIVDPVVCRYFRIQHGYQSISFGFGYLVYKNIPKRGRL